MFGWHYLVGVSEMSSVNSAESTLAQKAFCFEAVGRRRELSKREDASVAVPIAYP